MCVCVCVGFVMCGLVCVCVCVGFVMCGLVCVYMCAFCNVWTCVCVCVCRFCTVGVLVICIVYSEVFLTLTEVFPCFSLSCKANAMVKVANTGHGSHSSKLFVICVVLCIVFV